MSKFFNPLYPIISRIYLRRFLFALIALFLCFAAGVRAQTTVTVTADRDNTIYFFATGNSNGLGHLFAGSTAIGEFRRALVHFDVAGAVPAGAIITNAELTLTVNRTITGPANVEIYRLLNDWGEAGSLATGQQGMGAPALPGDATWNSRIFPSQNWAIPGGDFAPVNSAVTPVGGLGAYTWGSTAAMVADAQSWLDTPATNFGWVLIGDETVSVTAKRFASREDPTAADRPALEITYMTPTAAGVAIAGRVRTKSGWGISRSVVSLTGPNGLSLKSYTGTFGYYIFEDLPAGETYIISVVAPRYEFSNPVQVITALDNVTDFDFIANNR